MLRLFFQTFTKFLLKLHGIHLAGAPCDGIFSLVLRLPVKYLMIGRSAATLPLFSTPCHSFPYASVPYAGFRLHFQWSLTSIIPPYISPWYTLSHSGSWPLDYPWLKRLRRVDSKDKTRDSSLTAQGRRCSLKWFCYCPGASLSPRSTLGAKNPGANRTI